MDIEYDVYDDEEILQNQEDALKSFSTSITEICDDEIIFDYCKNNKIALNGNVSNTFSPKCIYVVRESKSRKVALLCDYVFDEEHGIAIIYENEKLIEIGPMDLVI